MIRAQYIIKSPKTKIRCVQCNNYISKATHVCSSSNTTGRWLSKNKQQNRWQKIHFANAKRILSLPDSTIFRTITTSDEYEKMKDSPNSYIDKNGVLYVQVIDRLYIDDNEEWIKNAITSCVTPFIPDIMKTPPHYWDLDYESEN